MSREMDGHPIPGAYGSPIKPRVWPRTGADAIQQVALLIQV